MPQEVRSDLFLSSPQMLDRYRPATAGTGTHTYQTDYILNRLKTATDYDGTYTLNLAIKYYDHATRVTSFTMDRET